MRIDGKVTLTHFLIEQRRRAPEATGELNALITDVSLACKAIAAKVAYGALSVSPEQLCALPAQCVRGKYLLRFDALDGSSNIDVNMTAGSVFSILRATPGGDANSDASPADGLQPGTAQLCAGYAIYGPATMLVLTLGAGTHAFTLDPMLGEWMLSHPELTIPSTTCEFAINASNSRFWEPAMKRYVDECLAGRTGPRRADFSMRWIASLVAETHRILMRGGVFVHSRDGKNGDERHLLRLQHEANPISFVIEQAGGRASNGRRRLMEVVPDSLQQRIGFVFGSREEVELIESYHREAPVDSYESPLFGRRGLFAHVD
jgi:fructose-1,6-bisphosphatase I/sedoheptulose-1,7-bisphosphatase